MFRVTFLQHKIPKCYIACFTFVLISQQKRKDITFWRPPSAGRYGGNMKKESHLINSYTKILVFYSLIDSNMVRAVVD